MMDNGDGRFLNLPGVPFQMRAFLCEGVRRMFRYLILIAVLFLLQNGAAFSGEDVGDLIVQAKETLGPQDYKQLLSVGSAILDKNPRDLRGYVFVLLYCGMTGKEAVFYTVLNAAKKQGLPEIDLNEIAAKVLYVSGQTSAIRLPLAAYEKEWYGAHEKHP